MQDYIHYKLKLKDFIDGNFNGIYNRNFHPQNPYITEFVLGPVVQRPISANPGLNFNLLFLFVYFCMIIRFKTLENKTSIEPERISGKTYSTWLISC
jgi:hypothetical protein